MTGAIIGRLPTAMAALALVRLVIDAGGDFAYASLLTAVYVVGGMIGQPLLARAVDRFGRPRLVVLAAAFIASVSFVAIALLHACRRLQLWSLPGSPVWRHLRSKRCCVVSGRNSSLRKTCSNLRTHWTRPCRRRGTSSRRF